MKINKLGIDFSRKTSNFAGKTAPKQHGNSSETSQNSLKTTAKHWKTTENSPKFLGKPEENKTKTMAKQKKQPIETGDFGPIYTQFEGKPKEAIKHLRKMQTGECPKALYREETGYVDVVWGNNDYGLCHIIAEHKDEFKQLGFEVEDFIPIVFAFGKYSESKTENKIRLIGEEFMLIVKTKWNDKNKRFVMSTFDLRPISRKNPKRAKRLKKKGK